MLLIEKVERLSLIRTMEELAFTECLIHKLSDAYDRDEFEYDDAICDLAREFNIAWEIADERFKYIPKPILERLYIFIYKHSKSIPARIKARGLF